eukprot:NODE_482_length_6938_cov_0.582541.p1 type:complete len:312 gc:universal NODE_482_length_6938_cov_0.582541:3685-4620(+)
MFLISLLLGISPDCPNIIQLAQQLNMHLTAPTKYNQLISDCCSSVDLACSNNRVVTIAFSFMKLNGTLNGQLIPPLVTNINFESNQLRGPFPTLNPSITYITLDNNYFNGTIGFLSDQIINFSVGLNNFKGNLPNIPQSAKYYSVRDNQFNGTLQSLPDALYSIELKFNMISGNLANVSASLQYYLVNHNLFTGTIPDLSKLVYFWGANNYLSGKMPSNHAQLSHLTLENNVNVFGSIYLNDPRYLTISNTKISDVVVVNTGGLQKCDLSLTPLLNNPNIQNIIGMCNTTGIYNAFTSSSSTSSVEYSEYH